MNLISAELKRLSSHNSDFIYQHPLAWEAGMAIVKKTANKSCSNIQSGENKPVITSSMTSIKFENTRTITKRQQKALDNFLFGPDPFGIGKI